MKTNTRIFVNLCTVVLFSVAISELMYTNEFHQLDMEEIKKDNKLYYKFVNKHNMAVGKKDESGAWAWRHISEHYFPKLFVQCGRYYYSLNRYEDAIQIPCTDKWYWCALQGPEYKYIPYYEMEAFSDLGYYSRIEEQSDAGIFLYFQVQGKPKGENRNIGLLDLYISMDYAYEVQEIKASGTNSSFPVFGKGKRPSMFGCEELAAKAGKRINL